MEDPEIFVNAATAGVLPGTPESFKRLYAGMVEGKPSQVGDVVQQLTDEEIDELLTLAGQVNQSSDLMTVFTVMSIKLATNEGLVVLGSTRVSELASRFLMIVQAEMLHRQGLVELVHRQLTMEKFEVKSLVLTEKAKQKFGGVAVRPSKKH